MTKERQYKREIKKLERIFDRIEKKEEEKEREKEFYIKYIENLFSGKYDEIFFEKLSLLYGAKRSIDNSKCKEKHNVPNPIFGKYLGIYTRNSKELRRIGIKDNYHLIKLITLKSIMNYIIKDYIPVTFNPSLNSKEDDSTFEEKMSYALSHVLDKIGKFEFRENEKNEIIIDNLENILNKNFSIDLEQIKEFLTIQLKGNGQALIKTIENMENYEKNKRYDNENIKEIIEKLMNLEKFNFTMNFLYTFKEKMNLEGKIYIKDKEKTTFYDYDELYCMAFRHCKNILEQIAFNVNTPIEIGKKVNDNPSLPSFDDIFFRNDVLKHYDFLKDFIQINKSKVKTKDENTYNDLMETLKKVDEIVENKKELFSRHLGNLQDVLQEKIFNYAKEGDERYYESLNEFINLSLQYSKVLEEDDKEILYLLNICEPNSHINVNEMAAKIALINYATSKIYLEKEKLEKLSLLQIYSLLHKKQKENYHKKNNGNSMDEIFTNYKLPLYNALQEYFNDDANLVRVVIDSKIEYMKAKREKNKESKGKGEKTKQDLTE